MLCDRSLARLCFVRDMDRALCYPIDGRQIQPCSIDLRLSHNPLRDYVTGEELPWLLPPNACALGDTVERVQLPNDLAGTLSGKSTLGRQFVVVHITAGHIDPGFRGTITLEIKNIGHTPIQLKPGTPIAQLIVTRLDSSSRGYHGRYQDQFGPTLARSHE